MKRAENHPPTQLAAKTPSGNAWSTELVELYSSHFSRFVHQAQRIVCDYALAEECVQDVFLAYQRKQPSHDPDRMVAYLRTMVRNAAISVVRRESRTRDVATSFVSFDEAVASAEDIVVAALTAEEILGRLGQLPGRQLQVIDCRIDGMNVDETADVLQISAGSVKTHRFRARNAMRAMGEVADAA